MLKGPVRGKIVHQTCPICKEKELSKISVQCTFCSQSNCKECCYKTRIFPRGLLDKKGNRPSGNICQLCDKKFFIKQVLAKYFVGMKNQNEAENNMLIKMDKEL
jgi:hypothetical protein